MAKYLLVLDQGTTSSRSILYDLKGNAVAISSKAMPVHFPEDGWVEQDAMDIWGTQLETIRDVTKGIKSSDVKAIGIANQRETLVVWDPRDAKPLAPAIVWQCRRSAQICARLRDEGLSDSIKSDTGLLLDPYFSGSKILWLLENVDGLKQKARNGSAVFGTVDSWLVYNLTKDKTPSFVTDPSNASRTMLFSLRRGDWSDKLLEIFSIERKNLATIKPSVGYFGDTSVLGGSRRVPICAVLGDQQASLLGHGCYERGSGKCTFGTGAFMLVNTEREVVFSDDGLLTTVAWQIDPTLNKTADSSASFNNTLNYALEGSIFMAGALIGWLKDQLGLISDISEIEPRAGAVENSAGVFIVPAFVGLGAPYWDDSARGLVIGLHRNVTANHLIRASLEAVAYQVADLLKCSGISQVKKLNIDGGMSANKLFCQILSDVTQLEVQVMKSSELTAFGALKAAGLGVQLFSSLSNASLALESSVGCAGKFEPILGSKLAEANHRRWKDAVGRSVEWVS